MEIKQILCIVLTFKKVIKVEETLGRFLKEWFLKKTSKRTSIQKLCWKFNQIKIETWKKELTLLRKICWEKFIRKKGQNFGKILIMDMNV